MKRNQAFAVVATAGFVIAVATGEFWAFVAALAAVYALACVSLVIVAGWSGQLNLHVAALGLGWGAYATYAMASRIPLVLAIVLAGVVTVPFSAAVATVAVRFRGLELAVATLAMGLVFERLLFRNLGEWLSSRVSATTFGSSFVPVSRPTIAGISFTSDRAFALFCFAIAAVVIALVLKLESGRTRRVLTAIRDRELAAEVAGIPTLGWRIAAFTLSVAVAATAGGLFASLKLGVSPESFGLDLSFLLLSAVIIAGVRSVWGGVAAGVFAAFAPELVRFGPLQVFAGERLLIVFAVGMILTLWKRPDGLFGPPESLRTPVNATTVDRKPVDQPADRHLREVVLRAESVSVAFGGVQALRDVDLWVGAGEVCALIGPNGAGKSTLFNVCSGVVRPDAGRVYLRGADVTHMSPHRRVQSGLARTFQGVALFDHLSVGENLSVAGHGDVSDVVNLLGLKSVVDLKPSALPFGLLRVVEAGLALMSDPAVLMLDEPSAGLDPVERLRLIEVLSKLRDRGTAVVVVEHDIEFVSDVADWVYVLDSGLNFTQGEASVVRSDPGVIARYLGDELEAADVAR